MTAVAKSRPTAAQPAAVDFAPAPTSVGHRALSIEQSHCMLTFIAGAMDTICKLTQMAHSFDDEEGWKQAPTIHAAELIARSIGAMADQATGSNVIGDADAWFFDRSFSELGKDGAA